MKIGYEATALVRTNKTGVDRYAECLLQHMLPLLDEDRLVVNYFALPHRKSLRGYEARNVSSRRIGYLPLRFYSALFKRRCAPNFDTLARNSADVQVFPNFVRWPTRTGKSVVVIHDLAFVRCPQYLTVKSREFLQRYVPQSIAESDAVIAVSEFTRREIIETFAVSPEKVRVVSNAVDHSFYCPRAAEEVRDVRARYKIDREYLLFTGTLEPRKNIASLVDAFELLPPEVREATYLVLAGGRGWLDSDIQLRIRRAQERGTGVIQLGYVPDADQPALYSGAKALVMPSHYEGFGLPLLEAMACGTPVIAADNSAMPDVIGSGGLLTNADDIQGLAHQLETILLDAVAVKRLGAEGLSQAKRFSWGKSASDMLQLLRSLN